MEPEVNTEIQMLADGYPEAVRFSDQYTFFCMAFSHEVNRDTVNTENKVISKALFDGGWQIHPDMQALPTTKKFSIFTPQVDASFYGETSPVLGQDACADCHHFIESRLDSAKGAKHAAETIILRNNIGTDYSFKDKDQNLYTFHLFWLDLWLFADGTGIISFKADLKGDRNISSLAVFHRHLRDTQAAEVSLVGQASEAEPVNLWSDFILNESLQHGTCLGLKESDVGSLFDPYQRNAKVLMAAQFETPLNDEYSLAWGRPLMDPPILLNTEHKNRIATGAWDTTLAAVRGAVVSGYATVRDMVLFELATVSDEGASLGWNNDKTFQYSSEYVREMIDSQFVEVWEHWNALMLRDSCVMLSFESQMPLVVDGNHPKKYGQAETRYYPLYILTYHLRYSLDRMSEELIDSNLSDAIKSRKLREKFIRFRNQYWFHEVTTDFLGREVFEKMKVGIGVECAYEAVKDEVDTVNAYIREKWAASTAGIIAIWSVVSTLSSVPNGWWIILGLLIVVLGFLAALYKRVSWAVRIRDWGVRKFKGYYESFLRMDLMR